MNTVTDHPGSPSDSPPTPQPRRATLGALRALVPYTAPHRPALVASGVAALVATLAGLAIPLVTRSIVDGPIGRGDLRGLPWLVLGVLGFGLVEAGLILFRRWVIAAPSNRVEAAMRADLFAHLQRLPPAFHDRWTSGQLLSRATSDLTTIRWFVAFAGIFLVVNAVTAVVGIVVLAWLSPLLGLITASITVPLVLVTGALERRYSVAARRAQDQAGDLATVVEESALGIRVLKSLGRGRELTARFVADAGELRATELRKVRLLAALVAAVVVLPELAVAATIGIGAYGVVRGELTLGTLIAAVTVLTYLHWPIASMGWLMTEASMTAAACTRFREVLDVQPAIADPVRPRPLAQPVRGQLTLRGVRFRYPGSAREILRGVDLTVRPGETMALVGATGSGKTTLAALLPRLYDVTAGEVLLDGVDVRALRLAQLRTVISTAFEDPLLISASVRENVTLSQPAVTDDAVWEALRIAGADGFVAALPWGLDTRIGEQGLSISGGQRQRLALARAVLGRPPVLVLDDPLSALDVHTESEVEAELRRVLVGVTALVVATRASTVALADRVALLHEGRVVAVGEHRELLTGTPRYRELLASTEHREGVRT
jgi:ATP-binding cassette, subfamily B, bacterial